MAHLLPSPKMQFFDLNGDPLNGGKVNTYEAGTSTRKATYTTAAASVANANPVILDSRGEASIFWSTGVYKIVLTDSADSEVYTVDNITLSATGAAGSSFRAGSGVPSDSLGSDGDRYLRTDTGQIYLKDAGAYTVESTLGLPASAVTNTPSGNLAAATVQNALNELQTELDTLVAWTEHAVTDGQAAGNLTGETVDFELYTSADYDVEILRGTTVISNGKIAVQNLNGTARVVTGLFLADEAHGVTFSVTQAALVAQLRAALDTGAGDGTIKLSRRLVPV
jgi:hypothetical protein